MKRVSLKKIAEKARKIREDHRERHRPSGFGFAITDSIQYMNPAQWDTATANSSIFLSREYLRALEVAGPDNSRQRYALIFRDSNPVAAVSTQLVNVSASRVPKNPPRKPVSTTLKKIEQDILLCGNLLSWGCHGVAFVEGEDREQLWLGVAEALYRIRRSERLLSNTDLIMVKDVTAPLMKSAESLRRISYRPLETEPNMVLQLSSSWRSFEDYLAALTGSYRKAARKVMDEVKAAGCVIENLNDVRSLASTIHDLYLQVHHRQAMRLVSLNPEFLPLLSESLSDRFSCTVARKGDEILGFVTTIKDGDTAVGYYIGFDTAANTEIPIYLRLLQAVVEEGIRFGCREISFGRTALEPKARLGAKPQPLYVWARHRVPAMNILVRGLMQTINHDEAPERSPFKPVKESSQQ